MKIYLENFGPHKDLTLETQAQGTVLFVVGKNRVGKSTIRDAIEFALLGSCKIRGFSMKKDVATHMIHEGQSIATVTLNVGTWTVRRSISRGGSSKIELDRTNCGDFVEVNASQWHDFFSVEADAVRVALDSDQFYRMDERERRTLLIAVKDSEGIDEKTVWDALGVALTSYADEDPARSGKLHAVCNMAAMLGFSHADKQAVEHRREEKRASEQICKQLEALPDTLTEASGIDVTRATLEQHQAKLHEIEEMVAEMLNDRATAAGQDTGRMTEAIAAVDRAQNRVDLAERKKVQVEIDGDANSFTLKEIKRQVGGYNVKILKLGVEVAEAEDNEKNKRALFVASTASVKTLAVLSKSPAQCPAVSFAMKCPVRPATFATAYEKSGGEADAIKAAQEKAQICGDELREAVAKLEDVSAERRDMIPSAELWQMAMTEATLQASELAAATSELADTQARVADLGSEQVNLDKVEVATDAELEAAESRVALGHKVVRLRALIDERKDTQVKLRTEKKAVDLEISWWDEVEKLLRPDGIEAALAGMATSRFAEILKTCDALAEVRITDGMELSINGHHITTRSKSEQLCGGIALQAAMCFQVGLPILVVDELDKLDAHWKQTFQAWASTAREEFSGGIVALATSDADPPGRPPDGFVTAWLREGEGVLHLGGGFK